MKTVTYETIVHKAGLPLSKGESVQNFTSALRDSLVKNRPPGIPGGNLYLVETFADKVICDVWIETQDKGGICKYFSVKYTRNADGGFTFGETKEVVRTTSFVPKDNTISISKTAEAGWTSAPGVWGGLL